MCADKTVKLYKIIRCVLEKEKEEGALGVQGQPGIQETVSKTDEQSHSVLNQGLDLLARALDPHLVMAAPGAAS